MKNNLPLRGYYTAAVSPHSGVGRVSHALREGLAGLDDVGDYVFDYTRGNLELRENNDARLLAKGFKKLKRSAFYLSFWGRVPHSQKNFLDNQNLAFLRLPNCGLCVYDLFYLTHPDNASDRLLGKLLYRGMGDYPFYLAISQYTKDLLCDTFKVDPNIVHVVPLDCDRRIFYPRVVDRNSFLQRWNLPSDRKYLLHVSSGDKRKNYPRILEAFGLVAKSFPEINLIRIGSALHADNLRSEQEIITRLGLQNRVLHLQNVSDDDLACFYSVAECLVFPSIAEGFGLPVLEAEACGCPCVTSNTTALAEVAGPLCTTVDPLNVMDIANGIQRVLNDPGRREREADANRIFLESFNWSKAQRLLREWMT